MDMLEGFYVGLSMKAPFGGVYVHRQMTGKVVVGAAFEDQRSLKAVLDNLKPEIKNQLGNEDFYVLLEDTPATDRLERLVYDTLGTCAQTVFVPMEVCRQSLEALIPIAGGTSKLEIDSTRPGAKMINDALLKATLGGVYDALALVAYQIELHFPPRRIQKSWVDKPWYE
ncbi:MAG TPA: hypothetical protein VNM15_05330 [Candidatus Binatia bacterium]|nr:hypothetical protein [Candidatus Binatia bacterium]